MRDIVSAFRKMSTKPGQGQLEATNHECPLISGPEFVESAPEWIDERRLRYTRYRRNDPERAPEEIVAEIDRSGSR
jgi:hypothetical protein